MWRNRQVCMCARCVPPSEDWGEVCSARYDARIVEFCGDAAAWRRVVAVVSALCASIAAAEPTPPAPLPPVVSDARVEVGYALSGRRGWLSDEDLATRFVRSAVAPSHLRVSGVAFLHALPLGLSAELAHEWFSATGPNLLGVEETHALAATRASLALAGRLRLLPMLALEGYAGWGMGALPLLEASTGRLRTLSLQHHGPQLGAVVVLDGGGPLAAQLSARWKPMALGAGFAQGEGHLSQVALGAQVAVGGWQLGGSRWHALLEYGLEHSEGATGPAELWQTSQRFGLGLRATFGEAPGMRTPPRPDPTGTVRGRVTFGDTGEPAAGVEVTVAGGPSVTADAQGTFTVPAMSPGTVSLTARAAGYREAARTVELPAGGAVDVELALARDTGPGTLRGTVTLAVPGGKPVPAAGVLVESPGVASVRTGQDGTFTIGQVGPGPVQVAIRAEGRRAVNEVVAVPAGGEATLDVVLEKAAQGALASLRGEVRDAAGRPVVAATLRVPEARATARSDRQGRFHMRLPAGRYTLVFSARGHVSQTKVVDVAEGDQAIFHILLVPLEP